MVFCYNKSAAICSTKSITKNSWQYALPIWITIRSITCYYKINTTYICTVITSKNNCVISNILNLFSREFSCLKFYCFLYQSFTIFLQIIQLHITQLLFIFFIEINYLYYLITIQMYDAQIFLLTCQLALL